MEKIEDIKNYIISSPYYAGKYETIDYIQDKLTTEQFRGYLIGNIFKYLSRYNKKNKSDDDLRKGYTYYTWLMQTLK